MREAHSLFRFTHLFELVRFTDYQWTPSLPATSYVQVQVQNTANKIYTYTLVPVYPDNGTYLWHVDSGIFPAAQYTVILYWDLDLTPNYSWTYGPYFIVGAPLVGTTTGPAITVSVTTVTEQLSSATSTPHALPTLVPVTSESFGVAPTSTSSSVNSSPTGEQPSAGTSGNSATRLGGIIGGVLGGLVLIFLGCALYFWRKSKRTPSTGHIEPALDDVANNARTRSEMDTVPKINDQGASLHPASANLRYPMDAEF
jgi:hypothetical protein